MFTGKRARRTQRRATVNVGRFYRAGSARRRLRPSQSGDNWSRYQLISLSSATAEPAVRPGTGCDRSQLGSLGDSTRCYSRPDDQTGLGAYVRRSDSFREPVNDRYRLLVTPSIAVASHRPTHHAMRARPLVWRINVRAPIVLRPDDLDV